MAEKRRVKIVVRGRVQGVFYRDTARRVASRLGLTGTVRNLSDGDVEIVAEGFPEQLDSLVQWSRTGPPAAVVEDIETVFGEATDEFEGFRIIFERGGFF